MTADDVAAALARARGEGQDHPIEWEDVVTLREDRAVLAEALQAERTRHALEWAEQDEELIALRAEVVRLREQLARHKPVWVSGPGGGYEEVVCDVCGVEMTEHRPPEQVFRQHGATMHTRESSREDAPMSDAVDAAIERAVSEHWHTRTSGSASSRAFADRRILAAALAAERLRGGSEEEL